MAPAHPDPLLSPWRPAREWEQASLYFCRDPTLWLLYHLFIILAQLYIFQTTPPPLIVPSPSRRPFLLYQNTLIMGCLSRLAFHGVLYSFEGPSIPESTHFNYPSSFERLPSPFAFS